MRCSTAMLFATLLLSNPALAWADEVDDEEVEEVEEVEAVQQAQQSPSKPSLLQITGRLHPILVHFPIAWLMLLVIVDLVTFGLQRESWAKAGFLLLLGMVAAAVPAVVAGLIRATEMANSPELPRVIQHRNLALITAGLCVLLLILRGWRKNRLVGAYRGAYLLLLLAAAALIAVTGHFGGTLVFGEAYLPF